MSLYRRNSHFRTRRQNPFIGKTGKDECRFRETPIDVVVLSLYKNNFLILQTNVLYLALTDDKKTFESFQDILFKQKLILRVDYVKDIINTSMALDSIFAIKRYFENNLKINFPIINNSPC